MNYNGLVLLKEAIESYLENDYQNFQIVVIENGSKDGSYEYLKSYYPEITTIKLEKNHGYSGGFNYGLDYAFNQANADYVIVTNNDVKADKHLITSLVDCSLRNQDGGFIVGKVYYYDFPTILQTVGKKEDKVLWKGGHIGNKEEDYGQYDIEAERFFADDIYTLVTKNLFRQVGGYDTNFFLQSEEFEWQARAKKKGFKIYYTPNAKLWHKDSFTIGKESALKVYYNTRNPMLVILLHKKPEFFRIYFRYYFNRVVLKTSLGFLVNEKDLKKFFSVWFGFCSGMSWGLRNKKFRLSHFI